MRTWICARYSPSACNEDPPLDSSHPPLPFWGRLAAALLSCGAGASLRAGPLTGFIRFRTTATPPPKSPESQHPPVPREPV